MTGAKLQRKGVPHGQRVLALAQRFEAFVQPEPTTGCLLWLGGTNEHGYGVLTENRKTAKAHRVAWQLAHGELQRAQCVLHKCDTPACVNIEHLFVGTLADNTADMIRKKRHFTPWKKVTHCWRGHEYTLANTLVRRDGRGRRCRACMKLSGRKVCPSGIQGG